MSDEQEEQIIAWENLEMEQVAAISEAVAVSNTITVFWRYCTGIDADTEQASASIPYTNGFHKVIEEDNEGVVYIQGNEASFASDEKMHLITSWMVIRKSLKIDLYFSIRVLH